MCSEIFFHRSEGLGGGYVVVLTDFMVYTSCAYTCTCRVKSESDVVSRGKRDAQKSRSSLSVRHGLNTMTHGDDDRQSADADAESTTLTHMIFTRNMELISSTMMIGAWYTQSSTVDAISGQYFSYVI